MNDQNQGRAALVAALAIALAHYDPELARARQAERAAAEGPAKK